MRRNEPFSYRKSLDQYDANAGADHITCLKTRAPTRSGLGELGITTEAGEEAGWALTFETRQQTNCDGLQVAVSTAHGGYELRFQRPYADPAERLWAMLTQPAKVVERLAEADMTLLPGGRVRLRWLNTEPKRNKGLATGIITAVDPPRLLEYCTGRRGASSISAAGRFTVTAMLPRWACSRDLLRPRKAQLPTGTAARAAAGNRGNPGGLFSLSPSASLHNIYYRTLCL